MEYIDVLSYNIRYDEKGKGDDILLIHGLGGSIDSWRFNRDELSKDFHIIAIDLLGFGLSDKPKIRYTISTFVKSIYEFLRKLDIKKTSIIGSSLGGQIAAEFAIKYPHILNKLILISPAGTTPSTFKYTKELSLYLDIFDARDREELRNKLIGLGKISEDYLNFMYDYIKMENARGAFLSTLKHSANAPRLYTRLDSIKPLTMVIWGKEDKIIPVRYAKPFINMKKCRLILLENCGHRVHYERPEIFNKLVRLFLEELK